MCRKRDRNALKLAMKNIERYSIVAGVTDDIEGFLEVLQILLPRFFDGATEEYRNISKKVGINQAKLKKKKRYLSNA